MSRTIDERVVSMEFDNSKFESNVKTSLSTLDKLKEALKFSGASKGIEDFSSSIEQTGNKFSALEVIATGALLRIGSQAVTLGERLVKSLSLDQISAGWQKFADKTTSVATLVAQGNAIEEVNSQLDRLNWFTDETSYNFTEMVANIAKFTATGKRLEESVNAMEGIATWAALSGQNAATASRAMYQLSQAMGSGYMRLEDYKSIQNASMDTDEFRQKCLDAAVALGTLKKTGNDTYKSLVASTDAFSKSQFAKSLTEGQWFTSDVMMKVFSEYASAVDQIYKETERTGELASEVIDNIHAKAKQIQAEKIGIDETEAINQAIKELGYNFDAFGLKAFEAAQKARTFRDVLDSVKDAVSTGWMNTFELIFGNAEEATEMWTDLANGLWDIFAGPGEARNKWLKEGLSSGWDRLTSRIESTGVELEVFENKIIELARQNGINIDELIAKYGSLGEVFSKGAIVGKQASSLIEGAIKSLSGEAEQTKVTLESVQQVVDDIWNGKYKNNPDRKKLMEEAGYDYEAYQAIVNKTAKGAKIAWDEITDAEKKALGLTNEQILSLEKLEEQAEETGIPLEELINNITKPSGRELLINTFYNVLGAIKNVIVPIQEAFQNIFLDSKGLYSAIEYWNDLSKKLVMSEQTVDKLRRTFEGLFAVVDIVLITIKDVAKGIIDFVGSILDTFGFKELSAGLLDFTANMGDAIVAFRNQVKAVGLLKAAFGIFGNEVDTVFKKVWDWIKKVVKQIYEIPVVNKYLSGVVTWIQNVWNAASKYLSPVVEAVKELIIELKNLNKISLSGIWSVLKDFGQKIKKAFSINKETKSIADNIVSGLINGFKEGIGKVITTVTEFVSKIITTVKDLLGIESPSKVFIAIGGFIIAGLIVGLLGGVTELEGTLGTIVDTIVKVFTSVDWNKVFVIGTILAFVYSVTKMTTAITNLSKTLTKAVHPFSSIVESITGFIGGMKTVIGNNLNAKSLRIMVESVLLLAAAVIVLSFIPWKQALKGVGYLVAIEALFAGLIFLFKWISKEAETIDFAKLAWAMASIGGTIALIALVIFALGKMDLNEASNGVLLLGTVFGLFYLLFKAFQNLEKANVNFSKVGTMMLKMSVALLMMAAVMKIIGGMPVDQFNQGLGFIAMAMIFFGGLMVLFRWIGDNTADMGKAGSMLLKMSAALLLMVVVVRIAGSIDQETINNGLRFITSVMTLFGGFILVFTLLEKTKVDLEKAGSMLMKMGIAMALMALVVKMLSTSSQSDIDKAYSFILGAEILFAGILIIFRWISKDTANMDKAGSMLMKMAIAIGILALVVKILASRDSYELSKGLMFITGVGVVFAALVAVSKFAGQHADKAGSMLMKMTVPLLALVACVALLSFLSPEDILKGTISMTALMGMFSFMIMATSKFGEKNNVTGALLGLSAALAVIVGSVYLLTTLDTKKALIAAGEITALLGTLIVVMKTLTNMKFEKGQLLKSVASLLVVSGVVAILAGILYMLDALDVQASIRTVGSLCVLLLAMSTVCYILSNTKFDKGQLGNAIIAMMMLSGILVLLSGVLWILQKLEIEASIPNVIALSTLLVAMAGVTAILSKFGSGSLAAAIKGAIAMAAVVAILGVTIAALAVLVSYGLPIIGENLSQFAEKSSKFFELMKNVDKEATEGALNVAKILMVLAGAEIATAIANFVSLFAGSTMGNMSSKLNSFGEAVVAFSEIISGKVDTAAVKAAKDAAEIVATLYDKLPKEGGLAQAIFGESMSLTEFANQMGKFGEAVVAFSSTVAGKVNKGAVRAAISAGEIIATLYEKLPKEDGWAQAIFGGTMGLDAFGTQMKEFGTAIVEFSAKVSGGAVNELAVDSAVKAGNLVATLYEKLPKDTGGLSHAIFGGTMSLTEFATQMKDFASGIVNFSNIVSKNGIDAKAVSAAVSAGEVISGLYNALPKEEGVLKKITNFFTGGGTMSMNDFGNMLTSYGRAVAEFYKSLSDIPADGLTNVVTQTQNLISMMSSMKDLDISGISMFKDGILQLSEIDTTKLVEAFSISTESIDAAINDLITLISTAIVNGSLQVQNALSILLTNAVTYILSYRSSFMSAGAVLIKKFKDGIVSETINAEAAISNMMTNCKTIVTSVSLYDAGIALVDGFASGITEETFAAEAAARAMAEAALEAAREALDINSPSKVFRNLAYSVPEGFAQGIDKMQSVVKASAVDMAKTAINSTKTALVRIGSVANKNVDIIPTIRPVVDLDAFDARTIQLGANIDASIGGPVDSLSSIIADAQNEINASNNEVITAINGLRADINAIYNGEDQEVALYVDGKKLASTLAKPMNRQLNILSKRGAY